MTIEQSIKEWLVGNGMFEEQAAEVVKLAKATKCLESMANRWTDKIEGYQDSVLIALRLSVKAIALEWIDAHLPKAWYRPLFA